MDEPKKHRSVSQLTKYRECGELYRLTYVDKVPNGWRPAAWLAQGKAFHEAIQEWEESGRSPLVDPESTYVVHYDQHILQMTQEEPNRNNWLHAFKTSTEDDIANRRLRGVEQVRGYVQYASNNEFVIADIDEWTLAIEMPFEVVIGTTLIKGAIDQVILHPNGYEVRDLKTGNRQTSALQLGVYKVALEKIFGWPVILGSYYYAKDNKVLTIPKQEMDRWTEGYLTELFDELERGIENKVFLPNPGSNCMLCPVKNYCRELGTL